jgi:hypothetical protein
VSKEQANITHICVVADASTSMSGLKNAVVRVIDGLVTQWQKQSLDLGDMTRLTLYQFSSPDYPLPNSGEYVECIWYDTDITRIKSLKGKYTPRGNTALIDATLRAQAELAQTSTLYGNHTFLFFVITDGEENRSRSSASDLVKVMDNLPDNWTVAALVPGIQGKISAQRYGFPPGNIDIWDATSERGVEEAGERIAQATASYMRTRSTDATFRSTNTLFVGGQVDAAAVKARLKPLPSSAYDLITVVSRSGDESFEKKKKPTKKFPEGEVIGRFIRIDDYMNRVAPPFVIGKGYYQLFSAGARTREKVQGNKEVAVMDKKTSQVYVGPEARDIVGLPHHDVTVAPDANPDYEIFIRSTSDNRHLPCNKGVKLMVMR